jgi:hypothetical protein
MVIGSERVLTEFAKWLMLQLGITIFRTELALEALRDMHLPVNTKVPRPTLIHYACLPMYVISDSKNIHRRQSSRIKYRS